jgi:hypothetical protein
LVFSSFFIYDKISFSVYCWRSLLSPTPLVDVAKWFFWSEDVCTELVDMPFFPDFVDGRRDMLVQDNTRTFPV